jgi:hypothetical protein
MWVRICQLKSRVDLIPHLRDVAILGCKVSQSPARPDFLQGISLLLGERDRLVPEFLGERAIVSDKRRVLREHAVGGRSEMESILAERVDHCISLLRQYGDLGQVALVRLPIQADHLIGIRRDLGTRGARGRLVGTLQRQQRDDDGGNSPANGDDVSNNLEPAYSTAHFTS